MALGGVATGNIKAQDAAIVAGNIKIRGGMFAAVARPKMTGSKTVAVAVFDVTSVKNVIKSTTAKISRKRGQPWVAIDSCFPNHKDSSVEEKA